MKNAFLFYAVLVYVIVILQRYAGAWGYLVKGLCPLGGMP